MQPPMLQLRICAWSSTDQPVEAPAEKVRAEQLCMTLATYCQSSVHVSWLPAFVLISHHSLCGHCLLLTIIHEHRLRMAEKLPHLRLMSRPARAQAQSSTWPGASQHALRSPTSHHCSMSPRQALTGCSSQSSCCCTVCDARLPLCVSSGLHTSLPSSQAQACAHDTLTLAHSMLLPCR